MSILLTRPPQPGLPYLYEDLGLGLVAAALRKAGFECRIDDGFQADLDLKDYLHSLAEAPEPVIGFPIHGEQTADEILQISSLLKKLRPDKTIILGGHPVRAIDVDIFRYYPKGFDYLVRGEGEETIVDLMKWITEGRPKIESIDGVSYRVKGQFFRNRPRKRTGRYGQYPWAARDIWENGKRRPFSNSLLVSYSRGCNHHCSFCSVAAFHGHGESHWLARPIHQFTRELSSLKEKYGISDFTIVDPNFIGSVADQDKLVRHFCQGIRHAELKIQFEIATRVDSLTPRRIDLLYEAGMRRIFLGLESGVDEILRLWHKGLRPSQSRDILNRLVDAGIYMDIGFIMLSPQTTISEIRRNVAFLRQLPYFNAYNIEQQMWVFHMGPEMFNMDPRFLLPAKRRIYRRYAFQDPKILDYLAMCQHLGRGLGIYLGQVRHTAWYKWGAQPGIAPLYRPTMEELLGVYLKIVEAGLDKIERGVSRRALIQFIHRSVISYQSDFARKAKKFREFVRALPGPFKTNSA